MVSDRQYHHRSHAIYFSHSSGWSQLTQEKQRWKRRNYAPSLKRDKGKQRRELVSQIEFTQMQNGAASEGLMTASGMILREDRSVDKELGVGKQQRPAKGLSHLYGSVNKCLHTELNQRYLKRSRVGVSESWSGREKRRKGCKNNVHTFLFLCLFSCLHGNEIRAVQLIKGTFF